LLDSLGINKGSKIALWMSDEVEHLVIRYAAALVGVTVIEVDPSLPTDALLTILKNEECRVLIASPRFAGQNRLELLGSVFATELAPAVKEGGNLPIQSKRLRNLKFLVCSSLEFEDGVLRFCDLPVFGNDGSYEQDDIAAVQSYLVKSDTVTVYYTPSASGFTRSGQTSHSQLLASALTAAKSLALTASDVLVTTAPYYSTFGLAAGPLAAASVSAKYVLPNKTFDASKTLEAATQQKATVLVVLAEHVDALKAELAKDEAKTEAKRAYNLSAIKRGVVIGGKSDAKVGTIELKSMSAL
jgi:acyl-CoA synthetase (AMP-forming)/AMP-acid ligase II